MLNFLRNNTKLIIWFVVIIFALLFGVSSFSLRKEDRFAGRMFDQDITFQELRVFQIQTRLAPPAEEIAADAALARQYTWQQMILAKKAKAEGIEVTDEEVINNVALSFQGMSEKEYAGMLERMRISPREFEEGVRERIRIHKYVRQNFPAMEGGEEEKSPEESDAMKERIEEYAAWVENIRQEANPIDYGAQEE